MVGPRVDEEKDRFLRRLKVGFALLVGASMALVALHGDARTGVVLGAGIGGTVVGGALAWWVLPDSLGIDRRR